MTISPRHLPDQVFQTVEQGFRTGVRLPEGGFHHLEGEAEAVLETPADVPKHLVHFQGLNAKRLTRSA